MRNISIISLLAIAGLLFAVGSPKRIPAGAKIFVSANSGFDVYLAAALQKKNVPVSVVAGREVADYELYAVSSQHDVGRAKVVFLGEAGPEVDASVELVDLKTGEVVFAYAVHKKSASRGLQSPAEACANI